MVQITALQHQYLHPVYPVVTIEMTTEEVSLLIEATHWGLESMRLAGLGQYVPRTRKLGEDLSRQLRDALAGSALQDLVANGEDTINVQKKSTPPRYGYVIAQNLPDNISELPGPVVLYDEYLGDAYGILVQALPDFGNVITRARAGDTLVLTGQFFDVGTLSGKTRRWAIVDLSESTVGE